MVTLSAHRPHVKSEDAVLPPETPEFGPLRQLLLDATPVGGIYSLGYEDALVLTNDLWKKQAGGLPRHCFLLATALDPHAEAGSEEEDDEEILLLRVVGPAPLPAENDLTRVRADAVRELALGDGKGLDVLTRNEIQFSALTARVLGTFYEDEVDGRPLLAFGSDLETLTSGCRYRVYKPRGPSLSLVASYPDATRQELRRLREGGPRPRRIRLGTVRYSSTTRRRDAGRDAAVPVRVNAQDFVAMKTALFGMTRLGKSNAMKTVATGVFRHAAESGRPIGQLLFDPAGEYANRNTQDGTALSELGPEFVTVFRYGADGSEEGVRPLCTNFFADCAVEVTWSIIASGLARRRDAAYVNCFLAADVVGPATEEDDRSAYHRARRRRAALYATLLRAGFRPPATFRTVFLVNKAVLEAVNDVLRGRGEEPLQAGRRGALALNAAGLRLFWDALLAAREEGADLGDWVDPQLEAILTFYRGSVGAGYRLLEPLRAYHAVTRIDDYCEEVLRELVAGKIVIVDLSLGDEAVLQFCSERVINHVVDAAARRFAEGKEPHSMQIFVEEAHRLFNRDRLAMAREPDPYVRLAKEAAKYRIGLVYATQEVSSVDPLVLANTSNWIVAHLNNKVQVGELARYYDFGDFAEQTVRAEDVGFVRLKTRSGRYLVPMQIDLFDRATVEAARQLALSRRACANGKEV